MVTSCDESFKHWNHFGYQWQAHTWPSLNHKHAHSQQDNCIDLKFDVNPFHMKFVVLVFTISVGVKICVRKWAHLPIIFICNLHMWCVNECRQMRWCVTMSHVSHLLSVNDGKTTIPKGIGDKGIGLASKATFLLPLLHS